MEYLPRREAAGRMWNQPKDNKCVSVSKAGKYGRHKELSTQPFDTRQRDTEFGVCPTGLQSCVGLVFH